uniref:scopoletin glucosyltransferase-like n=1 Tax=Erigeron canadensis TaxID=72917 RepID=UPI001CB91DFA|nr:scopoletin glucosyltransferase-like [Erigeron canadensis]
MASCHIVLFPFTAYGHTIPMADMAVLFASRGLQTTIIVTPSTAHRFSKSVHKTINCRHQITLHIIDYCKDMMEEHASQPAGPDVSNENISAFFESISMLQQPFENFIQESQPNCIISDMFYPWTTKIAAKYNIPRIVFNGSGYFSLCVTDSIRLHHHYDPSKSVSEQRFLVPHLPHEIMLSKKQLPHLEGEHFREFLKVLIQAMEAEVVSYGVIMNSFYELEPDYVRHYRQVMKRRTWHVGPVSLCGNSYTSFERGMKADIDEHECLKWLKSKTRDSVVYVCFGTMVTVSTSQLHEIATGLEACNQDFIWVINKKDQQITLILEEFEARMKAKEKGLVIKGWAPQKLILDHESVGGFVTHCGWNSVLEGVCAGVAMVAWPVMAEQFYNAKLVTDVLKIGVSISDDLEWSAASRCEGVTRDAIEKALAMVMVADGGEDMRIRARVLKEKAKSAVQEGGSSYSSLTGFIEEIMKACE